MSERALIAVETDVTLSADIDDVLADLDTVLEEKVPQILETELDGDEFSYGAGTRVMPGIRLYQLAGDSIQYEELGEAA